MTDMNLQDDVESDTGKIRGRAICSRGPASAKNHWMITNMASSVSSE